MASIPLENSLTDVEKADEPHTPEDTIHPDDERRKEASQEGDDVTFLVSLTPPEDPRHMAVFRKWLIVFVVSCGALCSTCSSSMVRQRSRPALHELTSLSLYKGSFCGRWNIPRVPCEQGSYHIRCEHAACSAAKKSKACIGMQ